MEVKVLKKYGNEVVGEKNMKIFGNPNCYK